MAVERLRLLHAGKTGYRGGGTIDCEASMTAAHPWEVRVRLSTDEVAGFERWQQEGTPLVVDIGGDRSGTATVGRVRAGSATARAVLDGRGSVPIPSTGAQGAQPSTRGTDRQADPAVSLEAAHGKHPRRRDLAQPACRPLATERVVVPPDRGTVPLGGHALQRQRVPGSRAAGRKDLGRAATRRSLHPVPHGSAATQLSSPPAPDRPDLIARCPITPSP